MTHIIQCKVENIGGAKQIEFAPKGETVTIGGPNRAGKTSAIRGLVAALGGKQLLPEDPVRHGAEAGRVVVELPEFIVRLDVEPDRSTRLRVETLDGARFTSPQKMLDKLFGNLSFDPGAFRAMDSRKQKEILMELTKLDFSDLDHQEKAAEADRAYKKKRAAELEAVGKSLPNDPNAPTSPPDLDGLTRELQTILDNNRAAQAQADRIKEIRNQLCEHNTELVRLQEEIRFNELELRKLDAELTAILAEPCCLIDQEPVLAQMRNAKAQAQAYDQQQKRRETIEKYRDAKGLVEAVEKLIKAIREEKAARLAAATFPIEGLGFDDVGVTYNGIPFAQLSESEQWEVSTAISFALNPQGIVFMGNCGGLDSQARQRVRERAAVAGVQLFLEVVDDQKDVQILIEDGTVKESRI